MASPMFSTGRHLRAYMGAEEGTLAPRRRTREGQLSESDAHEAELGCGELSSEQQDMTLGPHSQFCKSIPGDV